MRIPRYNEKATPRLVQNPRQGFGSPVGRGLEQAGSAVFEVGAAFKEAERVTEYSQRNSEMMQSLYDLEQEFENDPEAKVADFEERARAARQSIISQSQDPVVKRHLTESFNRSYPYKYAKIKQIERQHMVEKDLAALPDRMSMYINMAATSTSARERAHYRAQGKAEIEGRVAAGIIKATDGKRILDDFDYRVNRESVWEVANALPYDQAIKYLNKAKGLKSQDRNEFMRQLELEHKMEEARLEKEKKEQAEKTEKDFLVLYLANDLNYVDIIKSPLSSSRQEHWIDKLKKQADAFKKGKQEDLLTKSTPETLREVYKQIHNETGPKVTQEQIIDKIGNEGDNLTPQDANKYINDLEGVLKKSDPLATGKFKIAMQMIDKLYSNDEIGIERWAELKEEIENFLTQNPDAPPEKIREVVKALYEADQTSFISDAINNFKEFVFGPAEAEELEPPEVIKRKID